jgi:hypothetical protein
MTLLAIDPGSEQSAYVVYDGAKPLEFAKLHNGELLSRIRGATASCTRWSAITHIAIEMIASYGMPVGRHIFETCLIIGRIQEAWPLEHTLVYRRDIKQHLCGQARAKDANVRAALIDRWGGKDLAIGRKATPGPLFGITADCWAALAVAVTHADGAVKAKSA